MYFLVSALCLLALTASVADVSTASADDVCNERDETKSWTLVADKFGVKTLNKIMSGTPLLAFRGITDMDLHISQILAPFSNPDKSKDWVDLLRDMSVVDDVDMTTLGTQEKEEKEVDTDVDTDTVKKDHSAPFTTTDLVYQFYDLPWPVQDRDFIFKRRWIVDPSRREVVLEYVSVSEIEIENENEKGHQRYEQAFPQSQDSGAIRGESPLTRWVFRCIPSDIDANDSDDVDTNTNTDTDTDTSNNNKSSSSCARTHVDIQTLVDNKGRLPPFVVNLIQRSWPSKTLTALAALAGKKSVSEAVVQHARLVESGINKW